MNKEPTGKEAAQPGRIGRAISGLVLAPLVGGMLASAATILAAAITSLSFSPLVYLHLSIMTGLFAGATIGIPAALLVGLPVHLLMKQARLIRRRHYAALGGTASAMLFVAITGTTLLTSPTLSVVLAIAFALAGAIGGIVFWSIRRPDLDTRPAVPPVPPHEQKA